MSISVPPATIIRFGRFELEVRSGELRKAGVKIRLQQQPLQLLHVLLQHHGEVVSREELRQQLWGDGIYVDFDRSLNRAVVKLREALGDPTESPIYIETLPRIGYRFIAPVDEPVEASEAGKLFQAAVPRQERRWWKVTAASVAAMVLVLIVLWLYRQARPASPRVLNAVELSKSREPKLAGVVSDGARLYFAANFGGAVRAAEMSVSGGEVVPLPTSPDNVMIFDISPDKSNLLVGTVVPYDWPPELWILPVVGGAPHKVGDIRAEGATWMPDGQRILYARGDTLSVVQSDGSGSQKYLTAADRIANPTFSPDGARLRFDVHAGGNSLNLWEADASGRNAHPLLFGWTQPANECCGRWTADGRYYIFQSTRGGRADLWACRETGAGGNARLKPLRLTSGPLNMLAPFPSPDGRKIYAVGQQQVGELVRYDSASRQFVPYLNGISAEGVSFSRDGEWVSYVAYPEGTLWRSRVDGSGKLQLTEPPFIASVPVWSGDGKRIAFVGSAGAHPVWQVYVVSADGGPPRQLTFGDSDQFSPWWSPDGSYLIYSPHSWADTAISMMEVNNRSVSTLADSRGFCCPVWSRDGRYVFAAGTSPPRLMVYDVAKQKWSELWRGVFDYFDLSHDGSFLYFDSVWQSDPAVYRLRIRDRELERVVSLKNFRRTRGPNGYWFDLAPDDSPLLLRNLSTEQLYELDVDLP